ncbi:valine--tRNA ligase [Thermodesulfobacteriota bacterium]
MPNELQKVYQPLEIEEKITKLWMESEAFTVFSDQRDRNDRYVIMMPLPNVTGALHMGHAMDNTLQDLLIRWNRMMGKNTLWQPGTDHAGIATQAVVEKRLFELDGKTRHDIGREALVQLIWQWKDEYQERIVKQQIRMGCSCDWNRQRFTMDEVCSAAVREAFYRLFRFRLIYRDYRIVNLDCELQTVVADDEIYHQTIHGNFWYIRYPVINRRAGEPEYVVVATTRPETMLGDTAVACHPDPIKELEQRINEQTQKITGATEKDRPKAEEKLKQLKKYKDTQYENLKQLTDMAKSGRKVLLPIMNRELPLIIDDWVKPEMGSGCVKITPAHDPNDYEVWKRHKGDVDIVGIMNSDGSLNTHAGKYAGLDRFTARKRVVEDLQKLELIEAIEEREIDIGYSDRSKTLIEPFLSKQWFIRMEDVEGGVVFGRDTENEFKETGLAQAAVNAANGAWKTPSGNRLTFHPERYERMYTNWLSEKRDWCISRQLWWGHRIPVWTISCESVTSLIELLDQLPAHTNQGMWVWIVDANGEQHLPDDAFKLDTKNKGPIEIQVCLRDQASEDRFADSLEALGLKQDPDVLDTWFSSALWPFSTLGWPDPETAQIDRGQTPLASMDGKPDAFSYYYPGSCLVTARDIITLWVARMVILGLYLHGDLPFTDCFVHAKILDGKGVTMSKSKGNGIDPVDIIERYGADAMRYLLCDMETGMQDVRLPVQATCPHCDKLVELTEAEHGKTIFTYECTSCRKEFDVLGTMPDIPNAVIFSDRFEKGRNFCNKLWNASRFALMNLNNIEFKPIHPDELEPEDQWILSRLNRAVTAVTTHLHAYRPSDALKAGRDFFWGELCAWYLELIKPRVYSSTQAPIATQVLAFCMDQVIRLLHPFLPFITEALWSYLNIKAPRRGIHSELTVSELCVHAPWPRTQSEWMNETIEKEFSVVQNVISNLRELRSRYNVSSGILLPAAVKSTGPIINFLKKYDHLISDQAHLSELEFGEEVCIPHHAEVKKVGDLEIYLGNLFNRGEDRGSLENKLAKLKVKFGKSAAKLENPDFLNKAPAEVVESERKKMLELKAQIETIEKN